ncbi:aldehyde dehydrogenase family protein [Bacillus pseudomycoides]|uniref:aldehyde dehydrogenase family protein n=1 Tax=Bacillus pseudomycoides TaxID=64104 RepID=UPI000BEE315A|nr:aldehyde dehydrogenase family protein [Bacillus pseudomycoides]PDY02532.1 aldehyde dehydrogenase family protein [Bacillus pseudomycoides]PEK81048.1 aldehyde dehydrogenase family protein [Bacillus pseudomycoides]PEN04931.1 aldehyde dehydrogenase family protein [Bacillus pseudomycoides]PGB89243.1 aldehyde dehydrogenase family protein [Bacillus pseudomycoides]PHE54552.1 aldehyde dehydrogenase family protein [Bacillus pseudomycoides]
MRFLNYINGQWKEPSTNQYSENYNPHNGEVLGEFPLSSADDTGAAIASAKEAFQNWQGLSFQERASYLWKAAAILKERVTEIGQDLTSEEGKTLAEGIGETKRAISILEYYAGEANQPVGEMIPSANPKTMLYNKRVAVGPVGLITPWNFPIAIPAWKMAPALIYGNTVVIKPAEITPKSVYHLVNAFHEAGIPAGVINCVFGKGSVVGAELTENPDIKAISFTGSNSVGKTIQQTAIASGKKVQLEMGGKNPLVVLKDADTQKAVDIAIRGAFMSTGQKCTATSRVIIEDDIYEEFRNELLLRTKALKVGNPLKQDTFMGPCVSENQQQSVLAMIEVGKKEASLLCGGSAPEEDELKQGYYVLPTIFEDVPQDARIAKEEIFGPVICLFKVNNYQEAIHVANDTEYGLSASVCTNNLSLAQQFIDDMEVGMVHVNSETAGAEPQVPFGGMKNSSAGPREQGKTAAEFYTRVKTVYIDQV